MILIHNRREPDLIYSLHFQSAFVKKEMIVITAGNARNALRIFDDAQKISQEIRRVVRMTQVNMGTGISLHRLSHASTPDRCFRPPGYRNVSDRQ